MSRLLLIPLGAAGAVALSIFGCGGIDGADELFDSGSVGAGGVTSSTATAAGPTTGTTSTTSATTTSATSSTSATTTTTTSSVTTGASTSSASASSTGTGVVSEVLACGDTSCPAGALNACCWSKFAMPAAGACVNAPADNDGCKTFIANDGLQSRLECQTSAQCDQGTCCGHRTFFNGQNFFYDLVACVDTCTIADVTLCDPADASDVCPMVQTQNGQVQGICKTSASLPPGYFVCGAPG